MSEDKKEKVEFNDNDLDKVTGGGNYGPLDDGSFGEEFVDRGLIQAGKLYYQQYLDGKITKEKYHSLLENLVAIIPKAINDVNRRNWKRYGKISTRILKNVVCH